MGDKQLAEKILELIGGKKNVSGVTHCVTRLRVSVNDTSLIKADEIGALSHVLGTNLVGSQFQVILGGKVVDVFNEFVPLVDIEKNESAEKQKTGLVNLFLDTLSGIFTPIIPAIVGAGLLKGIIIFLRFYEIVPTTSDIYRLLDIFSDSAFYFLPILLAVSTATKFKCNKFVALAIAGILVHPNLVAMMGESATIHFLGIPVTKASYSSSVLPIILGIWIMSYVERWLTKVIPKILRSILVPLLTVLIVAPVLLVVVGPIGTIVGDVIGQKFVEFYLSFGVLAGAVLGAAYPYLILLGMHVGFGPVILQSISKFGVDYLMGLQVAANSAQAGATTAVWMKTKNKDFKALSGTAAINAVIGITEPALFGVTTKLKKPLIAVSIGGAVGGMIAGFFRVEASGMGTGPIAGIPLFLGPTFIYFVISNIVAFVVAFILTHVIGFEDVPEQSQETGEIDGQGSSDHTAITEKAESVTKDQKIFSPLVGKVVKMEDVKDNVFSSKMMGDGIAITPEVGKVVAPFDGIVSAIFDTKHAIGLNSEDGCELLIHVGIDTVQLNGEGFTLHVSQGDAVKTGDLLLEFDINLIKRAGYDVTTPIIITNTDDYKKIEVTNQNHGNIGDTLLKLSV